MPNPALRSKGKRIAVGEDDGKSSKKKKILSNDDKNNSCMGAHIDEKSKATVNFQTQIMEKLDEELKCNICTEILIRPSVLNCSHIFCEHCITKWKRRQGRCPICREKIDSQIRVLALDIFIDKTLEILSPEQKKARNEIISQREKHKRQNPRRSQRLKNRQTVFVTDLENIEDDFHLRALIDILTHLQNPITIDD